MITGGQVNFRSPHFLPDDLGLFGRCLRNGLPIEATPTADTPTIHCVMLRMIASIHECDCSRLWAYARYVCEGHH